MSKLLFAAFFSLLPPVRAVGIATTYWPGDGHSGKALGCPAEARRLLGSAAFMPIWPGFKATSFTASLCPIDYKKKVLASWPFTF